MRLTRDRRSLNLVTFLTLSFLIFTTREGEREQRGGSNDEPASAEGEKRQTRSSSESSDGAADEAADGVAASAGGRDARGRTQRIHASEHHAWQGECYCSGSRAARGVWLHRLTLGIRLAGALQEVADIRGLLRLYTQIHTAQSSEHRMSHNAAKRAQQQPNSSDGSCSSDSTPWLQEQQVQRAAEQRAAEAPQHAPF